MYYKFSKKKFITFKKSSTEDITVKGYATDIVAFPFAIAYLKHNNHKNWYIINRYSAERFGGYASKKKTEEEFQLFAKICDVNSIDFMNPKAHIDYDELLRAAKQPEYYKKYRKLNF